MLHNYAQLNMRLKDVPSTPQVRRDIHGSMRFPNGLWLSVVCYGDPEVASFASHGNICQPLGERRHEVHVGIDSRFSERIGLGLWSPEYNFLAMEIREEIFGKANIKSKGGFEHAGGLTAAEIDQLIPVIEGHPEFDCSPYDNPKGRAQLRDRAAEFYKRVFDTDLKAA